MLATIRRRSLAIELAVVAIFPLSLLVVTFCYT
jgi:hypothetical protein